MTSMHTLTSFDEALSQISSSFQRMGELVVDSCAKATKAYLDGDRDLALQAVDLDLDIDTAFEQIRSDCFSTLLRFQPVASDLRLVMAIEHSVGDLERAGDHAKNIARRVISNPSGRIPGNHAERLSDLGAEIVGSLRKATAAMAHKAPDDAKRVIAADAKIDALNDAIFDRAMVELQGSSVDAPLLVQVLFVSKALERIGDHATNIAEEVVFLSRGIPPGATRAQER